MTTPEGAVTLLHTRRYGRLLVTSALLGAPIAAAAYFFLALLNKAQPWSAQGLPKALGLDPVPRWWPLVPLLVAGLAVGLIARYFPGRGGPTPVDGLHPGSLVGPVELVGIVLAATASVGLGPVIGPEGPTIAIGGGLALLAVRALRRAAVTGQPAKLISVTGSFAAISTLLGSPLVGAVFLLEASGLGGVTAAVLLAPGLLASGVGALVFTGLGNITGLKPLSLTVGSLPAAGTPTVPQLLWAVGIGLAAPLLCAGLRRGARLLAGPVNARPLLLTPLAGVVVALIAIGYDLATDHPAAQVLYSGQEALPDLLRNGGGVPAWIMVLLVLAKALAYTVSLAAFRGGPIFPAVFLGVAGGVALSHLPGLPLVTGAAIGVTAMTTGMLRLPISSLVLGTLLFGPAGTEALPLSIVAAVLSYVVIMVIDPPPAPEPATPRGAAQPAPAAGGGPGRAGRSAG